MTVPFQVTLVLCLPRDAAGIRLVRWFTETALCALTVAAKCQEEIAVALSEACTNVVASTPTPPDTYEVIVRIAVGLCVIGVSGTGAGFASAAGLAGLLADSAESGRGLDVIAALSDRFEVTSQPGRGTTMRFAKRLS
jgi:serine/threonine-protein kinase RsbW